MTTQPPSRSTLADVLAAVLAADLPPRRKQDVASAIRAVAKVIGRAPGDIDATGARSRSSCARRRR